MNVKKFNFTNQNNLLLTIDWLTLNVDDVFSNLILDENNQFIQDDFVLTLVPDKRTAHFNKVFTLNYQGRFVSTITSSSNSPHILVNRAHIKFENFLFYENSTKEIACKIIEKFNIFYVSISRLDIAVDGVYLHPFINNYLFSNEKTSVRSTVRRYSQHDNLCPYITTTESIRNHSFDAYYIGQMGSKKTNKAKSERFIRYYCKTKEIRETNKKQYILDYFKNNSFDLEKEVYRFEVEISSSFLAKIKKFNWLHIFDHDKLQKLFQTSIVNLFDFHYIIPDTPKKYSPRLEIFKNFTKSTYQRIKKQVQDKVRTIKIGIKRMISEILTGSMAGEQNLDVAISGKDVIKNYIEKYNLMQWFFNRYPFWQKEARQLSIRENFKIPLYTPETFVL